VSKALGCLAHLGLVAALTMVIDGRTGEAVAPVLRPWVGLAAAVLLVLGASNLLHLLGGYGRGDSARSTLLARATTGEPPAEGGPMLVTGTVRPDGPALRAPLSGKECVAYEYRLYRRQWLGSRTGHRTTVYWGGYAFQSFMVDTGARAVRIGAMPEIVDEPNRDKTDHTSRNAREYLQSTRFEDVAGAEIVSLFGTMLGDRLAEAQTGIRRDWHRASASPDPDTLRFEERSVPVGATVSVAGHWLPTLRALVAEPGGLGGSPVTIVTGGPESLLRRSTALPSSASSVAIFGVLLLAMGAALAWAALAGYLAP
jgi:hypothetical protein